MNRVILKSALTHVRKRNYQEPIDYERGKKFVALLEIQNELKWAAHCEDYWRGNLHEGSFAAEVYRDNRQRTQELKAKLEKMEQEFVV